MWDASGRGLLFNFRNGTVNDLADSYFAALEISIPHRARPPLAKQLRFTGGGNARKAYFSLVCARRVQAPGSSSPHQQAKPTGMHAGARPDTGPDTCPPCPRAAKRLLKSLLLFVVLETPLRAAPPPDQEGFTRLSCPFMWKNKGR